MFYVTTQSFWSLNKHNVVLTENVTSVQYFKSFLLRKQKSVVSKSIFAIKKQLWSFITFILGLVVCHSVNQCDERHILPASSLPILPQMQNFIVAYLFRSV